MRNKWPSRREIRDLQEAEDRAAEEDGRDPDPICDCGNPAWGCECHEMAMRIGEWPDGLEYVPPDGEPPDQDEDGTAEETIGKTERNQKQ